MGTPASGGIKTLHHSAELTVLNIIWPPGMALYTHDHNLWAVIGLCGGQEDNTFFTRRRSETGLVRAGSKILQSQDTIVLGKDAIHAVNNPRSVYTELPGHLRSGPGDFRFRSHR